MNFIVKIKDILWSLNLTYLEMTLPPLQVVPNPDADIGAACVKLVAGALASPNPNPRHIGADAFIKIKNILESISHYNATSSHCL